MCTTLLAFQYYPDFPVILISNRDEFHARKTTPIGRWDDPEGMIAGKDLEAGGTWLGLMPDGRFGNLTNYRDFRETQLLDAPSRGALIPDFLGSDISAADYLQSIDSEANRFNGFSLLLGDIHSVHYFSNRENKIIPVTSGIHGLSNHLLDTPWPKVESGKRGLQSLLTARNISPESFFNLMLDITPGPDDLLPDTGGGIDFERKVSPLFIEDEIYGTRCTTVIYLHANGNWGIYERRYDSKGKLSGNSKLGTLPD